MMGTNVPAEIGRLKWPHILGPTTARPSAGAQRPPHPRTMPPWQFWSTPKAIPSDRDVSQRQPSSFPLFSNVILTRGISRPAYLCQAHKRHSRDYLLAVSPLSKLKLERVRCSTAPLPHHASRWRLPLDGYLHLHCSLGRPPAPCDPSTCSYTALY